MPIDGDMNVSHQHPAAAYIGNPLAKCKLSDVKSPEVFKVSSLRIFHISSPLGATLFCPESIINFLVLTFASSCQLLCPLTVLS